MQRRHPVSAPWPRLWLMTDERQGEALWRALERLPRGAGVVFRHYGHPEREGVLRKVVKVARRKGLRLLVGGESRKNNAADRHGKPDDAGIASASVHDVRELKAAERGGARLVFLSPVFPTRSHPGARTLGPVRFGLIARQARVPVIALGGMNDKRARRLPFAHGWAGIDAWSE